MQGDQQAGRLVRQRRMAEIFRTQFGKAEFFLASHFPQKVEVEFGSQGLGLLHHLGRIGGGKLQQHILDLDLAALAALQLDLVSLALLGKHGACLEIAGFFKK